MTGPILLMVAAVWLGCQVLLAKPSLVDKLLGKA
jgi:hypothetical protein